MGFQKDKILPFFLWVAQPIQTTEPAPPQSLKSITFFIGGYWSGVCIFYFKYFFKKNKNMLLNIIYYINTKILIKNKFDYT